MDREGAVTWTVVDVAAGFAEEDVTVFAEILAWALEPQAAKTTLQRTTAIATDNVIGPQARRGTSNRPRRKERRRFEATTLAPRGSPSRSANRA